MTGFEEAFRRDGFLVGARVLSAGEAAASLARIERFERDNRGRLPVDEMLRTGVHLVCAAADDLVRHPRVLDVVETLLGPDLIVWDSDVIAKEPRSEGFVSWHQDLRYWGVDSHRAVTAWIALTDASGEMGCMRFLPGSHREGLLDHADTFAQANLLTRGQTAQAPIDEGAAVEGALRAGEMSVHHGLALHASTPNRSARRRVGLAIRYATPAMRQIVGAADYAQLVRGEDRFGHFRPAPRPARDADDAAVAAWRRIAGDQAAAYFEGVAAGRRRWAGGDGAAVRAAGAR